MKYSPLLFVSLLAQTQQAQAGPISSLVSRSRQTDAIEILIWIFGEIADDEAGLMWEWEEHPQMCEVTMETHHGAACKAYVHCDDGTREYNADGQDWSACFVGGRQYFNDPRIGDFSITFSERDGASQGEGLTTPILQVQTVGDWQQWPVQDLAMKYSSDCIGGIGLCNNGPHLCWKNSDMMANPFKRWGCGVPKIGKSGGDVVSEGPINEAGYAPGRCGLHVIQYQKPDPAKDSYSLEVTHLKDNNEATIGATDGKVGPSVSLTSKLPMTVEIKTGGADADPVSFAYGGDMWDSNDERCTVGAYDNGKREMDCGFACA